MIIIPKERSVVEDLNSYYLNLDKLLEHYRGVLESGAVYFYSPAAEAVVYFDEENALKGLYQDKIRTVQGKDAIDRIMESAAKNNFSVSVYRIRPDRLYYWANLANSSVLHSGLTSEFADLEGLLKKMENENLTGYIEVQLNDNAENGLLFFYNGEMLGGSCSQGMSGVDRSREYRNEMIKRCQEHGGIFNVYKTDLTVEKTGQAPAAHRQEKPPHKAEAEKASAEPATPDMERVIAMLQSLLSILEKVARANKKRRSDFETLLNRKFMEKVDKYEFLDPFAKEFTYSGGKLSYTGDAPQEQLVAGVVECVGEMVSELGVDKPFRKQLPEWHKTYVDEVYTYNIIL
ncbi:MAG: hypothetical protein R6X08_07125 [Desulfosalsimonadaceae bacterium]